MRYSERPLFVAVTKTPAGYHTTINYDIEQVEDEFDAKSVTVVTEGKISADDYAAIVSALVNNEYPSDRMDAVRNNYMANESDMKCVVAFTEMQRWRGKAKVIAREAMRYIMDNGLGNAEGFDALENTRALVLQDIENYDISDDVNAFMINGDKYWLTKPMRESLLTSLGRFQKAGIENFPFVLGSVQTQLPCDTLDGMITQLEVYATQCLGVTTSHQMAVAALETEEALMAYDYTQNYPTMLEYTL